LRGDPGVPDLLVHVTQRKAGQQLLPGVRGEVVRAAAQHPADPVQRVVLAAAVTGTGLLDPAADVVDGLEAESGDVEAVQHPDRVRQRRR
jgi:hypothetical protein